MSLEQNAVTLFAGRSMAIAAALSVALVFTTMSGDLLRPLLSAEPIRSVPYLRSALTSLVDIGVIVAMTSLAAARSPVFVIGLAGLSAPVIQPLLWGAAVFAPTVAYALWKAPLAELDGGLWWTGLGGPFMEELGYRGLAIGVLMRLCGWSLWPACLLPAAYFGAVHIWQGEDSMSIAGVVAITGLGGLLFGWLFVRWGFNLWPPVILHAGLNLQWSIFDLGETAIGGATGNILRLAVVALAIALTFMMAPKRPLRR